DFSFGVGKAAITIPGAFINFAPIPGSATQGLNKRRYGQRFEGLKAEAAGQGSGMCFGGLQSSDSAGINIFGDIALKAAFVVFDGGNSRIGFAKKPLPAASK